MTRFDAVVTLIDAPLIDVPPVDDTTSDAVPDSETEYRDEGRLWRWLAYAGASALGGSPVPSMMRYEDAVAAVTTIGSEG